MSGDEGPYVEMDGPGVWVPQTVPYLKARQIAKEAIQDYGDRLRYLGKVDAILFGYNRDCECDEACTIAMNPEDHPDEDEDECRVPSWAFEIYEP